MRYVLEVTINRCSASCSSSCLDQLDGQPIEQAGCVGGRPLRPKSKTVGDQGLAEVPRPDVIDGDASRQRMSRSVSQRASAVRRPVLVAGTAECGSPRSRFDSGVLSEPRSGVYVCSAALRGPFALSPQRRGRRFASFRSRPSSPRRCQEVQFGASAVLPPPGRRPLAVPNGPLPGPTSSHRPPAVFARGPGPLPPAHAATPSARLGRLHLISVSSTSASASVMVAGAYWGQLDARSRERCASFRRFLGSPSRGELPFHRLQVVLQNERPQSG